MLEGSLQYYKVTFSSPEIKTVGDYCLDPFSPALQFENDETTFLDIKDDTGISNRDRLFNCYTEEEKQLYKSLSDSDLPMRVGVILIVPVDKVNRSGLLTQGLQVISTSDVAFKASQLAIIEADPGYVSTTKAVKGQIQNGSLVEKIPEITLWIWCRALSPTGGVGSEMNGAIMDLTPFVESVSTSVTSTGGNFQIKLPPLICEEKENGTWGLKEKSLVQYINSGYDSVSGQGYVAEGSLFDQNLNRNQFLFHNIISPNDLVFIRYEQLGLEKNSRFDDASNFYINKNQIPGKVYDMIGLVDIDSSSLVSETLDASITINGRDLVKLFIEDGSYWYTFEQMGSKMMGQGSVLANNKLLERVLSKDAGLLYNLWYSNSIENVFEFVINQLSAIKIIPDDLLSGYDQFSLNKRNTVFDKATTYKEKPLNQILQSYKDRTFVAIKRLRKLNNIANSNEQQEEKEVIKLFDDLKSFFFEMRERAVRKVAGNTTMGWKEFDWLNPNNTSERITEDIFPKYFNKKLYTTSTILVGGNVPHSDVFKDIITNVDFYLDIENSSGEFSGLIRERLANGIWQIIKLNIDKSVASRRLFDSSLSMASGSMMNFFKKICQAPFVEFFTDTYGDIFGITVRKPITDQVGLISMIEGRVNTEDGKVTTGTPAVVDIEDKDVIREELSLDDSNVYSWYHLSPEAVTLSNEMFSYAYLPALWFQEYADIWGNRPLDLVHKYMPYEYLDKSVDKSLLTATEKQAISDLKFMVESNQANPFTRRGMLVLNGDRRLKVGNVLRYKPTGEIFLIDAVQQNFKIGDSMIDRTTSVTVSRGMVEQLIYGVPYKNTQGEADHISYFNIINTSVNYQYINTSKEESKRVQDGFETINVANSTFNSSRPVGDAVSLSLPRFDTSDGKTQTNVGLTKLLEYKPDQQKRFSQFITAINAILHNGYPTLVEIVSGAGSGKPKDLKLYRGKPVASESKSSGGKDEEGGLGIKIRVLVREGRKYVYAKEIKGSNSFTEWYGTQVPQLAKQLGLLWGGDSTNGDREYFQIPSQSITVIKKPKYKKVKVVTNEQSISQDSLFSNFRVNKDVFDFFLRREQFKSKYKPEQINRTVYNKDTKTALGH